MPCQLITSKFSKKCFHIGLSIFGFQIRLAIYFLLNKFAWSGIKDGGPVNVCEAMFGLTHVCSVPSLSCHPALVRRPARQLLQRWWKIVSGFRFSHQNSREFFVPSVRNIYLNYITTALKVVWIDTELCKDWKSVLYSTFYSLSCFDQLSNSIENENLMD